MRGDVSAVKGFLSGLVNFSVKGREVLNSLGVDSQGDVVVIWHLLHNYTKGGAAA